MKVWKKISIGEKKEIWCFFTGKGEETMKEESKL